MQKGAAQRWGWAWKSLLGLALLPLFPGSCQQRRPQTPAAPPPPNYLEQGDRFFDSGDYANSIAAYTAYLNQNPDGTGRDHALFRIGLVYALPSHPLRDAAKASAYFEQLIAQYPQSPLRLQAELVAGLQRQVQSLEQQTQRLAEDLEQQRALHLAATSREAETLREREKEIAQLQWEVKNREERIRQLSEELEKLKAIDMQRRPATPPR